MRLLWVTCVVAVAGTASAEKGLNSMKQLHSPALHSCGVSKLPLLDMYMTRRMIDNQYTVDNQRYKELQTKVKGIMDFHMDIGYVLSAEVEELASLMQQDKSLFETNVPVKREFFARFEQLILVDSQFQVLKWKQYMIKEELDAIRRNEIAAYKSLVGRLGSTFDQATHLSSENLEMTNTESCRQAIRNVLYHIDTLFGGDEFIKSKLDQANSVAEAKYLELQQEANVGLKDAQLRAISSKFATLKETLSTTDITNNDVAQLSKKLRARRSDVANLTRSVDNELRHQTQQLDYEFVRYQADIERLLRRLGDVLLVWRDRLFAESPKSSRTKRTNIVRPLSPLKPKHEPSAVESNESESTAAKTDNVVATGLLGSFWSFIAPHRRVAEHALRVAGQVRMDLASGGLVLSDKERNAMEAAVDSIEKLAPGVAARELLLNQMHVARSQFMYQHFLWMFNKKNAGIVDGQSSKIRLFEEGPLELDQDELETEVHKAKALYGPFCGLYARDLLRTPMESTVFLLREGYDLAGSDLSLLTTFVLPLALVCMLGYVREVLFPAVCVTGLAYFTFIAFVLPHNAIQYRPNLIQMLVTLLPVYYLMGKASLRLFIAPLRKVTRQPTLEENVDHDHPKIITKSKAATKVVQNLGRAIPLSPARSSLLKHTNAKVA